MKDGDDWLSTMMRKNKMLGAFADFMLHAWQSFQTCTTARAELVTHQAACQLMYCSYNAAMRIMEVRDAYCIEDFEWDMCRKIARQDMKDANVNLMRQYADIAFAKQTDGNNEARVPK